MVSDAVLTRSITWALILTLAVAPVALAEGAVLDGGAVERATTAPPLAVNTPADEPDDAALADDLAEDYDPWEPFNQRTFAFNHGLDRFVMKPVAKVWMHVLPDVARRSLGSAFQNLDTPRRLANNLLQRKFRGAAHEVERFVINSTIGLGALIDVAKRLGIETSDEDMGQTLGVYGIGPGPYLVLPLLPPLTVRDGIGLGVDGLLSPWTYAFPFAGRIAIRIASTVNERADNLETFEDVEEGTIDLYAAVRNGYLQRRRKAIPE
jgi:phospholipid-binding lipoprotein MlaA